MKASTERRKAQKREYYKRNRAALMKYAHDNRLKCYGLSRDEYETMLTEQRGVCVICNRPNLNGRSLGVDHDHLTGAVRDLLCSPCNTALGQMQDNPDRLRAAAAYLERHNGQDASAVG